MTCLQLARSLTLWTMLVASAWADPRQPVRLIFDTDMMGDVDDVGTVAALHALAGNGETELLAMGLSGKNRWSPLCLDALNVYFGRPGIPIGIVKGPAFDRRSKYAEQIAREFPHNLQSAKDIPDAALLYRRILARQPDKSVIMVSVGQVTNFANLLKTSPDELSDLSGLELVKRKVRAWVCMGGKIPQGRESNLIHDGPAAAYAIKWWPTRIVFSGYEIGNKIMTGAGLKAAPRNSPVRRAYELYNGLKGRQSWDQTAVLYAVRGLDGGLSDLWSTVDEGFLDVDTDGSNQWKKSPDKDHVYLVEKMDPKRIAAVIEALMLTTPENRRARAHYQRLIRKIEPDAVGRPRHLPRYVQLFQREMINDARLFPFRVEAQWTDQERARLTGFVGFEENCTALRGFLQSIGFRHIDDRIEILPSKDLGTERFGFIKMPHCFSFDRPTGRQEVVTDCLLGSPVFLLKEAVEEFFLALGVEGYVGYIRGKGVQRVNREAFARYQTGKQVHIGRDIRTGGALRVPAGARLKYVNRRGGVIVASLPTGREIELPADGCVVRGDGPDPRIERVLENAKSMLGVKYVWGGNTSEGLDCSGLIQTAFAAEGIQLPRDANQQMYLGRLTATRWYRDGLRRGDTLYFLGKRGTVSHTAIYVGDGRYIEAVRPVVRHTSFNPDHDDYNAQRAGAFCFAKRLMD